eukprot:6446261-Pyramimonas_sp.AAC.1
MSVSSPIPRCAQNWTPIPDAQILPRFSPDLDPQLGCSDLDSEPEMLIPGLSNRDAHITLKHLDLGLSNPRCLHPDT